MKGTYRRIRGMFFKRSYDLIQSVECLQGQTALLRAAHADVPEVCEHLSASEGVFKAISRAN